MEQYNFLYQLNNTNSKINKTVIKGISFLLEVEGKLVGKRECVKELWIILLIKHKPINCSLFKKVDKIGFTNYWCKRQFFLRKREFLGVFLTIHIRFDNSTEIPKRACILKYIKTWCVFYFSRLFGNFLGFRF